MTGGRSRDAMATSAPPSSVTGGILLLAAGYSRRFGAVKLGASLHNGDTVVGRTLLQIRQASPLVRIVTRPELRDLLLHSGAHPEELLICHDAELGMGHTLAAGMVQIPAWDACLVCLADMPFIRPDTYSRLLLALQPDRITMPTFHGQTGNPVGFGSDWFDVLRRCTGDAGAREVVRGNPKRIDYLEINDPAILKDIDTPDDLARHQAG